jgi:hypothetical protein
MPNCYISPETPSIKLIKAMISMGGASAPTVVFGQMLASFPPDPAIPLPVLKYTFGPLIVHSSQREPDGAGALGWLTADLIKKYRPRVDLERIEILTGERPDLVSPTEMWMVMLNAVHDHPLGYTRSQIYCWAVQRSLTYMGDPAMAAHLRKNSTHVQVDATDEDVFDGDLSHDYRELAHEIVAKVVKHSRVTGALRRKPASTPRRRKAAS